MSQFVIKKTSEIFFSIFLIPPIVPSGLFSLEKIIFLYFFEEKCFFKMFDLKPVVIKISLKLRLTDIFMRFQII